MNTRTLTIILLLLVSPYFLFAQKTGKVTGTVITDDYPLVGATIAIMGTTTGTASDIDGKFLLENITSGVYKLKISSIGYKSKELEVKVTAGQTTHIDCTLKEDALGLEEMVVTGTMQETYVSQSPIKIDVIPTRLLERTVAPTNIVEALKQVNGVQEVTACGVCFTNSISINGLPGAYTAILLDGAPVYGNLAAVYGLNGIPTTIVDRFEVIKGPNSTLYGSEAVAGVINIITKDPDTQPAVAVDLMGTSHLEAFSSISFAPKIGKFKGLIGINHAYMDRFEDDNNDGFSDSPSLDRLSIFTKWKMDRASQKKFSLSAKFYYEDRRNGVEDFLTDRAYKTIRGDDQIYGESIYTNRIELFGSYELNTSENIRVDYSFSYHDQDSYYGADNYTASQIIGYTNWIWDKRVGNHGLVGGLTLRYNNYDDNTIATENDLGNTPDKQFIPGIFLQDEWEVSKKFTALMGARLDNYEAHGAIFSPRLNLKYKLGDWTSIRSNFGTGFRIVNLFTEDHAFVSGNREIIITEDLKPEGSYNASFNLNHVYTAGESQGMLDIDAYYTYFTNAIFPNYDDPDKIVYANTDGHAVTKGISMNINHHFGFPLSINLGMNMQQTTETSTNSEGNEETSFIPFATRWSGVMSVNYEWKSKGRSIAYTVNATGPMSLPRLYDLDGSGQPISTPRPTISQPFAIHNLQFNQELPKWKMQLYAGIQNIFDFRQEYSPLVGFNDPNAAVGFSNYFDTSYAYAPLHGRELYLGVRWNIGK